MRYDVLGMPVLMALLGKGSDADSLSGVTVDIDQTDIDDFFEDPLTYGAGLLGSATAQYVYDLTQIPLRVGTIQREEHDVVNPSSAIQMQFQYSDGLGRPLMQKVMADDGDALYIDGSGNLNTATNVTRWIGTGKTNLNNKSKPIKQYEPYFSTTHLYENDVALTEIGYSPEIYYDVAGRVVKTVFPNGTFAHTVFDAWMQTVYDANDNTEVSDWGLARRLIPTARPLRSVVEEADAYDKAIIHNNTPAHSCLDTLGRTFCNILHNKIPATGGGMQDEWLVTSMTYDVEGNIRTQTDALDRVQLTYRYDMLGNIVYQDSFDTGEGWMGYDIYGKPLVLWDTNLRKKYWSYDERMRPTHEYIKVSGVDYLLTETVYGDAQTSATTNNLVGKPYEVYDSSGKKKINVYDFKVNVLDQDFNLLDDKTLTDIDWNLSPTLSSETFNRQSTYDALNRLIQETLHPTLLLTP